MNGSVLGDFKGSVLNGVNGNVLKLRGVFKGNKNVVGNCGGVFFGNKNVIGNSGGFGGLYRNKKVLKIGMYEIIFLDVLEFDE